MRTFNRGGSAVLVLLLFLFAYLPFASGQSTTGGAIAGTVVDATGAAIPGAVVTIHNNGTNAELKLVSDSNGYFKAPVLQPGVYTVTISSAGFGEYSAKTVPVTVGSISELHPQLKTGAAQESVEVTGVVPVLQFESPEVASTLTTQEIVNLPLNGGRWSNLALLTPGAASDSNGFGLIAFRGISPLLNNVEIDGADDNQAFFSEERGRTREGYSTSQIAIAEFQVNTGVYSAEYGRAAGAVLNAVTKSGTNQIHGQTYFYDRDNNWGALNPFTTFTSITPNASGGTPTIVTGTPFQPKDWRKRWGFGAGGPLIKDKLFWFYAYDQYKRNFPGVAKPNQPGAFFGTSTNVQWASLTLPGSCTTASTSKTSSGVTTITTSSKLTGSTNPGDINACALAWRVYGDGSAASYAKAAAQYDQLLFGTAISSVTGLSTPGLLDVLGATPRTGDEVLNTPKMDWQITPKEHASFLFHRLRWDSPGGVQTQATNNYAKDSFGTDYVKLDYGLAKLDSLITTSISNELRFQYGRELNDEGQQTHTSFTDTYLKGTSGIPVQACISGTATSTCSSSSGATGFTAGMPYYSFRDAYPDERKSQLADTANWIHKGQNIKFGFDILKNHDTVNNLYESNGVYTYTYLSDFFADILKPSGSCDSGYTQTGLSTQVGSGAATSYPCYYGFTQGFGTAKFSIGTQDYGFFVQDNWKLTSRLSLNIGFRYDYEHVPPPFPSLIATSLLNVAVGGKGPFADAQAEIGNHPSDTNNWSPRVGFSWDPFGNGKTAIHAGYGLYYGRIINSMVLNTYEAVGSPNGQFTIPSIYSTTTAAGAPAFPQVRSTGTFPTGPSIDFFDKNFQNPQIQQFNLSVQRQVFGNTTATVYYLGALGRELPNFLNLNLNNSSVASSTNTAQSTMFESTLTVAAGTDGTCGPLACGTTITSNVYAKTAKPTSGSTVYTYNNSNYGGVTKVVSNINSSYNGFVFDLTNRSNKYAQYDINYTWSHSLDYNQNQGTSPSTNGWYDPWSNAKANYGNSNFNVPNRFVAWAMLNYPGKSTGQLKYLTNGWHANPIIQVQNGLPYSAGVSGSNQPSTTYGSYTYAAAGSGMNGSGASSYLLQIGRNTYKFPTTTVLDLRLQKDLKISERFNFELLGEVFNLLNHQNVTGVNSTAYNISGSTLVYQSPSGSGTSATGFGTVNNADSNFVYSQRQMQLGIKLDF
jgi:hypothetical protein